MEILKGMFFTGVRKDGRAFSGEVESTKKTNKGTLVVVWNLNPDYSRKYATVYLTDCISWKISDYAA